MAENKTVYILGGLAVLLGGAYLLMGSSTPKKNPSSGNKPAPPGPVSAVTTGLDLGSQLVKAIQGATGKLSTGGGGSGSGAGAGIGFQGQIPAANGKPVTAADINGSTAATGYSVDASGNVTYNNGVVGKLNSDGSITLQNGSIVNTDGTIYNPQDGSTCDPTTNILYNAYGEQIGTYNPTNDTTTPASGYAFDNQGNYLGKVNPDGTVEDDYGNIYDANGNDITTQYDTGQWVPSPANDGTGTIVDNTNNGANNNPAPPTTGPTTPACDPSVPGTSCYDGVDQGFGYDQYGNYVGNGPTQSNGVDCSDPQSDPSCPGYDPSLAGLRGLEYVNSLG